MSLPLGGHLTRRHTPLRRHVHDRIIIKEIPRPQQYAHWLTWHDGEIFRRRKVYKSKCMPEHNVLVVNRLLAVANPLWQSHVLFS